MAHEAEAHMQLEPTGVSTRCWIGAFAAVVLVMAAIWELNAVYDWQVPNRQLPDLEQFPSPRVQSH